MLSVHLIGPQTTHRISEAVLGIPMGITAEQPAGAFHPHPRLSETLMEAAMMITGTVNLIAGNMPCLEP